MNSVEDAWVSPPTEVVRSASNCRSDAEDVLPPPTVVSSASPASRSLPPPLPSVDVFKQHYSKALAAAKRRAPSVLTAGDDTTTNGESVSGGAGGGNATSSFFSPPLGGATEESAESEIPELNLSTKGCVISRSKNRDIAKYSTQGKEKPDHLPFQCASSMVEFLAKTAPRGIGEETEASDSSAVSEQQKQQHQHQQTRRGGGRDKSRVGAENMNGHSTDEAPTSATATTPTTTTAVTAAILRSADHGTNDDGGERDNSRPPAAAVLLRNDFDDVTKKRKPSVFSSGGGGEAPFVSDSSLSPTNGVRLMLVASDAEEISPHSQNQKTKRAPPDVNEKSVGDADEKEHHNAVQQRESSDNNHVPSYHNSHKKGFVSSQHQRVFGAKKGDDLVDRSGTTASSFSSAASSSSLADDEGDSLALSFRSTCFDSCHSNAAAANSNIVNKSAAHNTTAAGLFVQDENGGDGEVDFGSNADATADNNESFRSNSFLLDMSHNNPNPAKKLPATTTAATHQATNALLAFAVLRPIPLPTPVSTMTTMAARPIALLASSSAPDNTAEEGIAGTIDDNTPQVATSTVVYCCEPTPTPEVSVVVVTAAAADSCLPPPLPSLLSSVRGAHENDNNKQQQAVVALRALNIAHSNRFTAVAATAAATSFNESQSGEVWGSVVADNETAIAEDDGSSSSADEGAGGSYYGGATNATARSVVDAECAGSHRSDDDHEDADVVTPTIAAHHHHPLHHHVSNNNNNNSLAAANSFAFNFQFSSRQLASCDTPLAMVNEDDEEDDDTNEMMTEQQPPPYSRISSHRRACSTLGNNNKNAHIFTNNSSFSRSGVGSVVGAGGGGVSHHHLFNHNQLHYNFSSSTHHQHHRGSNTAGSTSMLNYCSGSGATSRDDLSFLSPIGPTNSTTLHHHSHSNNNNTTSAVSGRAFSPLFSRDQNKSNHFRGVQTCAAAAAAAASVPPPAAVARTISATIPGAAASLCLSSNSACASEYFFGNHNEDDLEESSEALFARRGRTCTEQFIGDDSTNPNEHHHHDYRDDGGNSGLMWRHGDEDGDPLPLATRDKIAERKRNSDNTSMLKNYFDNDDDEGCDGQNYNLGVGTVENEGAEEDNDNAENQHENGGCTTQVVSLAPTPVPAGAENGSALSIHPSCFDPVTGLPLPVAYYHHPEFFYTYLEDGEEEEEEEGEEEENDGEGESGQNNDNGSDGNDGGESEDGSCHAFLPSSFAASDSYVVGLSSPPNHCRHGDNNPKNNIMNMNAATDAYASFCDQKTGSGVAAEEVQRDSAANKQKGADHRSRFSVGGGANSTNSNNHLQHRVNNNNDSRLQHASFSHIRSVSSVPSNAPRIKLIETKRIVRQHTTEENDVGATSAANHCCRDSSHSTAVPNDPSRRGSNNNNNKDDSKDTSAAAAACVKEEYCVIDNASRGRCVAAVLQSYLPNASHRSKSPTSPLIEAAHNVTDPKLSSFTQVVYALAIARRLGMAEEREMGEKQLQMQQHRHHQQVMKLTAQNLSSIVSSGGGKHDGKNAEKSEDESETDDTTGSSSSSSTAAEEDSLAPLGRGMSCGGEHDLLSASFRQSISTLQSQSRAALSPSPAPSVGVSASQHGLGATLSSVSTFFSPASARRVLGAAMLLAGKVHEDRYPKASLVAAAVGLKMKREEEDGDDDDKANDADGAGKVRDTISKVAVKDCSAADVCDDADAIASAANATHDLSTPRSMSVVSNSFSRTIAAAASFGHEDGNASGGGGGCDGGVLAAVPSPKPCDKKAALPAAYLAPPPPAAVNVAASILSMSPQPSEGGAADIDDDDAAAEPDEDGVETALSASTAATTTATATTATTTKRRVVISRTIADQSSLSHLARTEAIILDKLGWSVHISIEEYTVVFQQLMDMMEEEKAYVF